MQRKSLLIATFSWSMSGKPHSHWKHAQTWSNVIQQMPASLYPHWRSTLHTQRITCQIVSIKVWLMCLNWLKSLDQWEHFQVNLMSLAINSFAFLEECVPANRPILSWKTSSIMYHWLYTMKSLQQLTAAGQTGRKQKCSLCLELGHKRRTWASRNAQRELWVPHKQIAGQNAYVLDENLMILFVCTTD